MVLTNADGYVTLLLGGASMQRPQLSNGYRQVIVSLLTDRDGYVCGVCNNSLLYEGVFVSDAVEVDHVIPFHLGGADELNNLRLTHRKCNHKGRPRVQLEPKQQPVRGVPNGRNCLLCSSPLVDRQWNFCGPRCGNVLRVRRYRDRQRLTLLSTGG